jgi:hypothetical protein
MAGQITEDMEVLGSDGGLIGRVDGVSGDRIKLKRAAAGGPHHFIPAAWVSQIDLHVHLDRSAALARDGWTVEAPGGSSSPARSGGSGGAEDAYSLRKSNWVIWIAVAALLAVTLYALINGFRYAT